MKILLNWKLQLPLGNFLVLNARETNRKRKELVGGGIINSDYGEELGLLPCNGQKGLSGGSDNTESACNAGDLGLIPGLGRPPGEQNIRPLQYSFLENSMDRGAWWAIICGVAKSETQLSD